MGLRKYSRTPHLPWSKGISDDDEKLNSVEHLQNKPLIITEKMDGENCTWTRNNFHARSLDSNNHPSRNYVKGMWAERNFKIPEDMRIIGENLYAKHSIKYTNLKSYFLVFGIYQYDYKIGEYICLSWIDTLMWLDKLELDHVPVILGSIEPMIVNEKEIHSIFKNYSKEYSNESEGYVIRNLWSFKESEFSKNVAKYVRKDHVQSSEHWMNQKIIPNELMSKKVIY